ncbi:uncharacterized protein LOC132707474 [Cylas formicarius]|uniref:uncharacterized protein LOC132707474 n=1 Tax=Cylas formicarius TaxID=197179 RepID=UPI00295846D7|nr:uncharacterized protein LOC132707474 [Cylas formicarius]
MNSVNERTSSAKTDAENTENRRTSQLSVFRKFARRKSHGEIQVCGSASSSSGSVWTDDIKDHHSRSRSVSPISGSTSESDTDTQPRSYTSVENLKRIFQNLNIYRRSQNCNSGKELDKKAGKKSKPKSILRPPVTYIYVKGLSGLPTQRIPKRRGASHGCNCSMHYLTNLNHL